MSEEKTHAEEALAHYVKIKQIYEEFRRLREKLGIPLRPFVNPETTRQDLSSREFMKFLEELGKRGKR